MSENDEWPALREELSRKSFDVLAGGIAKYNEGKLSAPALILMTNTIYDLVSGLVSNDVLDAIYAVRQETLKDIGK